MPWARARRICRFCLKRITDRKSYRTLSQKMGTGSLPQDDSRWKYEKICDMMDISPTGIMCKACAGKLQKANKLHMELGTKLEQMKMQRDTILAEIKNMPGFTEQSVESPEKKKIPPGIKQPSSKTTPKQGLANQCDNVDQESPEKKKTPRGIKRPRPSSKTTPKQGLANQCDNVDHESPEKKKTPHGMKRPRPSSKTTPKQGLAKQCVNVKSSEQKKTSGGVKPPPSKSTPISTPSEVNQPPSKNIPTSTPIPQSRKVLSFVPNILIAHPLALPRSRIIPKARLVDKSTQTDTTQVLTLKVLMKSSWENTTKK